jgi:hypothetical protein
MDGMEQEHNRTPTMPPSEPDHPDLSHRARTHLQHTAARSTRQRRPSSLPQPTPAALSPQIHSPRAPSPAYIKPPFFPEKIPTIPSYLLDIISSLVGRRFELAGVGRAPERAAVPGVPAAPSSFRLDKVEEEELLRRTAARRRLPSLPRRAPAPPSSQQPPVSIDPVEHEEDDPVPIRFT